MPQIGFKIQVLYADGELIKLRVSAWNGTFGGGADIYEPIGALEKLSSELQAFPRDLSDTRQLLLGTFDPHAAGGAVSLRFYCVDGSGHTCVDSKIESDRNPQGRFQSVTLSVAVEPAAVDSFVAELRKVGADRAGSAFLQGTVESHNG